MSPFHSFSDCNKYLMCDEVDENKEIDAMTGSPRSGNYTSMNNKQGFGTHSDLYENVPSEIRAMLILY